MSERERPRSFQDLERLAGIDRTVPPAPTQRDVERMTEKRLRAWPAWRRKLRGLR